MGEISKTMIVRAVSYAIRVGLTLKYYNSKEIVRNAGYSENVVHSAAKRQ